MTKRKRRSVHDLPWTTFEPVKVLGVYVGDRKPDQVWRNSRYQVDVWKQGGPAHPQGRFMHLAIRDHDWSARIDFRDLQRIKNELCGEPHFGVMIFPPESSLVDTANQSHLYVFENYRLSVGFTERLVSDGTHQAPNRPFDPRPADCLTSEEMRLKAEAFIKSQG